MRRIVVNEEIKLLAEKSAKGLDNGTNLSAKPLDNLKALKETLSRNTTKIIFSAKQSNPKGNKKKLSLLQIYLNMQNTHRLSLICIPVLTSCCLGNMELSSKE